MDMPVLGNECGRLRQTGNSLADGRQVKIIQESGAPFK